MSSKKNKLVLLFLVILLLTSSLIWNFHSIARTTEDNYIEYSEENIYYQDIYYYNEYTFLYDEDDEEKYVDDEEYVTNLNYFETTFSPFIFNKELYLNNKIISLRDAAYYANQYLKVLGLIEENNMYTYYIRFQDYSYFSGVTYPALFIVRAVKSEKILDKISRDYKIVHDYDMWNYIFLNTHFTILILAEDGIVVDFENNYALPREITTPAPNRWAWHFRNTNNFYPFTLLPQHLEENLRKKYQNIALYYAEKHTQHTVGRGIIGYLYPKINKSNGFNYITNTTTHPYTILNWSIDEAGEPTIYTHSLEFIFEVETRGLLSVFVETETGKLIRIINR